MASPYPTGLGPYRKVHDNELRSIFFLTPQTGRSFMFSVTTLPPPGCNKPVVTQLLRAMLYLLKDAPSQRAALMRDIAIKLPNREDITIRAKLQSLCRHVLEEPWAFPALASTEACRRFYADLKPVAETADTVANTGSDPVSSIGVGAVLTKLVSSAAGFGWGLANYFGGKTKDYYEFYANRIATELAMRGIPPSSL